jgi:hypothetical protein
MCFAPGVVKIHGAENTKHWFWKTSVLLLENNSGLDPSPRKGDHGSLRAEAQVTKVRPSVAQDDV